MMIRDVRSISNMNITRVYVRHRDQVTQRWTCLALVSVKELWSLAYFPAPRLAGLVFWYHVVSDCEHCCLGLAIRKHGFCPWVKFHQ